MNEPKVSIQVKVRQREDYSEWDDIPVIASVLLEQNERNIDGYARYILKANNGVEARWNEAGSLQGHYVRKEGFYRFWHIEINGQVIGPPMMKSLAEEWHKSLNQRFKSDSIAIVPVEAM